MIFEGEIEKLHGTMIINEVAFSTAGVRQRTRERESVLYKVKRVVVA